MGGKEYQILTFPRVDEALKAAVQIPPDLFLLDINMPGLNGYDVYKLLKTDNRLAQIPILFLGTINEIADLVKAFQPEDVDYLTKPFQIEEVVARVRVHLALRQLRTQLQALLSETLLGVIKALNELLAFADPEAYSSGLQIAHYVKHLVSGMEIENAWEVQIAALMMSLGNLFAPEESNPPQESPLCRRIHKSFPSGDPPTNESGEDATKLIAHILRCIPRLDSVAAMIEKSSSSVSPLSKWKEWPADVLGGQILKVASGFQKSIHKRLSEPAALLELKKREGYYHPVLVDYLKQILATQSGDLRLVESAFSLSPGMVLDEDLVNESGLKMLGKGMELTEALCMTIRKYDEYKNLRFPIRVLLARQKEDTHHVV
ncbi:MAG: two-component system response regulator [bacterium]